MLIPHGKPKVNPTKTEQPQLPYNWAGLPSKDVSFLNQIIRSLDHIHSGSGKTEFVFGDNQTVPATGIVLPTHRITWSGVVTFSNEGITIDYTSPIFSGSNITLPPGFYLATITVNWLLFGGSSEDGVATVIQIAGNLYQAGKINSDVVWADPPAGLGHDQTQLYLIAIPKSTSGPIYFKIGHNSTLAPPITANASVTFTKIHDFGG